MTPARHSCLYTGVVRHRRMAPRAHRFRYRVAQLYLDLDELEDVFRGRLFWSTRRWTWASFRRSDHLGDPHRPLAECVRELIYASCGRRPSGPIRLLTYPRYLGYVMNPVSFYYVFDAADQALEFVLAEVHNTPWGERYPYVLDLRDAAAAGRMWRFRFPKAFHVSPFMSMDVDYDWRFAQPGADLLVHMQNRSKGRLIFDANLRLERREIGTASLAAALVRYPVMTWKVVFAIYWQALRLWWKRCPVFEHPRYSAAKTRSSS